MCLMLNNENVFVISNAFRFSIDCFKINIYIDRMTYFFYRFHEIDIFGHFKNKKPISKVIPGFQKVKRTSLL